MNKVRVLENIKQTAWLLADNKVRHPYNVLKAYNG